MKRVWAVAVVVLGCLGWVAAPSSAAPDRHLVVKGMPPIGVGRQHSLVASTAGVTYHYVYNQKAGTASGASGRFIVADPAVPSPDLHSLAELSVESADGEQIVEEGWTVDPGQFGDQLPHLFVFHWVDGSPTCYDGCGFVSTSSTVVPGMPLNNGTSHVFKISFSNGRWHISNNGVSIGYYPESLWSTPFVSVGLTQWFGEVAAQNSPPCAQMGDGLLPSSPEADEITQQTLIGGAPVSVSPTETDPTLYGGVAIGAHGLRLGGPGGCGPQPQLIAYTSSPPQGGVTVGPKTYRVAATGGGSGNPVTFAIATDSAGVCTISGDIVTFTGAGQCEIDANQAGNPAFTAAPLARQLVKVRFPQDISFLSHPPRHARVAGPKYDVTASGGQSGLAVVLSIAHHSQEVCRLMGKRKVEFIGVGTCSIHANQKGDATYAPAQRAKQHFAVHRR